MNEVTLIGIDLGKHVFHLHAQNAKSREVFRKKLSRSQLLRFFSNLKAVTVAMEACAGSHWLARKLNAMGHVARLVSPQYVRPFVKSNKNDFVDAEAICEAASRPTMRFVEPRTEAQQLLAALHRVRESLVIERTATINRIHGILLEFGIVIPLSKVTLRRLPDALAVHDLPSRLIQIIHRLHEHYRYLVTRHQPLDLAHAQFQPFGRLAGFELCLAYGLDDLEAVNLAHRHRDRPSRIHLPVLPDGFRRSSRTPKHDI